MSINLLPTECLQNILGYLCLKDWLSVRTASKLFYVDSTNFVNYRYELRDKFRQYLSDDKSAGQIIYYKSYPTSNLDKGLLLAAEFGDLNIFKLFLDKGATNLYYSVKTAIKYDKINILNYILKLVELKDYHIKISIKKTAFYSACRYGNKELINSLMIEGDYNHWFKSMLSLIKRGDPNYLTLIEDFKKKKDSHPNFDVDMDQYEDMLCKAAILSENISIIKYVVFNINKSDLLDDNASGDNNRWWYLMFNIFKYKRYPLINILIDIGFSQWSLCFGIIIEIGNINLVKTFLKNGAEVANPLYRATMYGHLHLVKFFYRRDKCSLENLRVCLNLSKRNNHELITKYLDKKYNKLHNRHNNIAMDIDGMSKLLSRFK